MENKSTELGPGISFPRCPHGKDGMTCPKCVLERVAIAKTIRPLAEEFWAVKGGNGVLESLLARAYRMGMKRTEGGAMNAEVLKLVWPGYHCDFEIDQPPTCFDGLLIVHTTAESMKKLLKPEPEV